MSNIAKWALLSAGAVMLIALILNLPFVQYISFRQFGNLITRLLNIAGGFFTNARGLINCFLKPWGRTCLSALMVWFFGKWALLSSIKVVTWTYHFIFRG